MTRKSYPGAAEELVLQADINAAVTSFTSVAVPTSNWPVPGASVGPFVIVMNPGGPNEEKMLIGARSAGTFSSVTRGYDGTTAVSHTAGETIQGVFDANSADEANAHTNDTTRDDHSQYLTNTRHAAISHLIGTHLPAPAAPATPTATGSASAGASTSAARADHLHDLPASMPRGVLGTPVSVTSGASVPQAGVDLVTHGAVTPAPGTRRLRISGMCEITQTGSLSGFTLGIQEGSTVLTEHPWSIVVSGQVITAYVEAVVTATSASHTYKLRARSNGSNACTMQASADSPCKIVVEDIGV